VNLADALSGVLGYSHLNGKPQAPQLHLNGVVKNPPPEVPLGLRVRVSGNAFSLPTVPWIAFLDPDVTKTATDGLYVVYLFRPDLSTVYLSMKQGVTQHLRAAKNAGLKGKAAQAQALTHITQESEKIRSALDPSYMKARDVSIDLAAPGFLPAAYEAGNIAAVRYELPALPTNGQLAEDLQSFSLLYDESVAVKKDLAGKGQITHPPYPKRRARQSRTVLPFSHRRTTPTTTLM
jgi:hypothetical protein